MTEADNGPNWDANNLTVAEHFEDSFRRMSTTNWWDCERFEGAVEVMLAALQQVAFVTVRIRLGGIDLPSFRALLTACIRTTGGKLNHMIVEVPNHPETRAGSPESIHRTALISAVEATGALLSPSRDVDDTSGVTGTPSASAFAPPSLIDHHPELEYLFRNDHLAVVGAKTPFAQCQLDALVAARTGRVTLLFRHLDLLRDLAASGEEIARSCSMTAVAIARFNNSEMLGCAESTIERGFRAVDESTADAARIEKGWLHNNLAFIHVLKYSRETDPAELTRASRELQRAFEQCVRVPTGLNSALHLNVTANAVRLLEMDRKYTEALTLLETFPGSNEHPALLYRRAVLLSRLNRTADSLDALRSAELRCSQRQWPFKLAIANATAYVHVLESNYIKATEVLELCLALAICKRSRREAHATLPNLFHCLCAALGNNAAEKKIVQTIQEAGLASAVIGVGSQQPGGMVPPASKLPPYIPELDLSKPVLGRRLINSMLDSRVTSFRSGESQ